MSIIKYKHMVFMFCALTFLVVSYTALTYAQTLVPFCMVLCFTSFLLILSSLDNNTILFDFRDSHPRYTKSELEKAMLEGFEKGYQKAQEELNANN